MRKKIIILSCIVIAFLIVIYVYFENTVLEITNYCIVNNKLPNEFNNYKIIQISDYHNEKSNIINDDLLRIIKKEKPNIIVITGDFIDSRKTNISVAIDLIKEIEGVAPIYYVTGNHEARITSYDELKRRLVEYNVIVLENETATIKKENSQINIIGVNDPQLAYEYSVDDSIIIKDELEKSNYDKSLFSILLSHRPEVFKTYVEKNIDLVLSGHAHGGQIRIPFVGGVVAPNQGFFPKYTSGLFKENNTNMIISRGIGNSIIPIRINNRPELVIIKLRKSSL